jgi:asparagine N-glycosylation enzyme membrane subunit Stt3
VSTDVPPSPSTAGRVPEDPYASDPDRPLASAARPWWRWLFVVPGLAAVGWGAAGLLRSSADVPLGSWAVWFVGGALVHDLVIAPLVVVVGALLARLLPRDARAPVVVALVVSGPLVLIGGLFALDPGGVREPGFLPLPYARNLVLLVGALLTGAAVWAVARTRRRRRRG